VEYRQFAKQQTAPWNIEYPARRAPRPQPQWQQLQEVLFCGYFRRAPPPQFRCRIPRSPFLPFAFSFPATLMGFVPTQIRRNNASPDTQSGVVVDFSFSCARYLFLFVNVTKWTRTIVTT
jgi:hypothetical protein